MGIEMKKLKQLTGKKVALWCECYIYHGEVVEVDETTVVLGADAGIVYETGELQGKKFKDKQQLPGEQWCVSTAKIESFGVWEQD